MVPYHGWFDPSYDAILNEILTLTKDNDNFMVITSCGMGAKALLADLHQRNRKGVYLDVGSGLDWLCTKQDSRGWKRFYSYEQLEAYFSDLLPDNWNSSEFSDIYAVATVNLGVHL